MKYVKRSETYEIIYDQEHTRSVERQATVEKIQIKEGNFYGFFDETGHEKLSPGHDLFAISGFCFANSINQKYFEKGWADLRKNIFKVPLNNAYHSAKHLRKLQNKDDIIKHVTDFLVGFDIKFVSSCVLNDTFINAAGSDKETVILESILASLSLNCSLALDISVERDEWYFEHSDRLSWLIMMSERGPRYGRSAQNGGSYFIRKSSRIPFIEVADFLSFIVRCHVHGIYRRKISPFASAFETTFANPDRGRFGFLELISGWITVKSSDLSNSK